MKFTIYTTSTCPFCVKAKNLLKNNNFYFDEISLDDTKDRLNFKQQNPNMKTVPQIFLTVDGKQEHIGGYIDLRKRKDIFDK